MLYHIVVASAIEPRIHVRGAWKLPRNQRTTSVCAVSFDCETDPRNSDSKRLREFDSPSSHESTKDTILIRAYER